MNTRRSPQGGPPRRDGGRPTGDRAGTPNRPRNPAPHPGAANYPPLPPRQPPTGPQQARTGTRPITDPRGGPAAPGPGAPRPGTGPHPARPYPPPPTSRNPHLAPLTDPGHPDAGDDTVGRKTEYVPPEKVTVVRVIARRSRYFTARGIDMVHRAATADGADRSGLTQLTVPVVVNFAVDAAMAIALANTFFFSARDANPGPVLLYLLITIAPFAVIAPLIGPLLDRLQSGRRLAMASTFGLRALLALLMIMNSGFSDGQVVYNPWVLYPCALGLMVLSKSFGVLKSAVVPRVLPPSIDLMRVNARLTTFGLFGGTIVGGAIAAVFEVVLGAWMPFHAPGAMILLMLLCFAGAYFCMKIPKRVEVTEGEVPTTLSYRTSPQDAQLAGKTSFSKELTAKMRQPLGRTVVTGLWGNGTIRSLTGFLTMFVAFYAKAQGGDGWAALMMLGAVGAAAGVGNAVGNGIGTRIELKHPPRIIVMMTAACFGVALLCAIMGNLFVVIIAGFVGSAASAIAKICLDSSIQDDLPDESRASAFGRSETVLQLAWVIGAGLGVFLGTGSLWLGFTVITVILGLGLAQTLLTSRGATLVPGFGGRRPEHAAPTVAFAAQPDPKG